MNESPLAVEPHRFDFAKTLATWVLMVATLGVLSQLTIVISSHAQLLSHDDSAARLQIPSQAQAWHQSPQALRKVLIQLRPPTPTAFGVGFSTHASLRDPSEALAQLRRKTESLLRAAEMTEIEQLAITPTMIVTPPGHWDAASMEAWMLETLENPDILAIERDQVYAPHDVIPWGVGLIGADRAWTSVTPNTYGTGVKVAILDSGATLAHADLRYAGGYDVISGSTNAGAWSDSLSSCRGHGTHIAGILGALDNGSGIVGVAPEVSLYAVKIFQDLFGACLTLTSSQVSGINWATANGIKVLNLSFGGPSSASIAAALASAAAQGVISVASAGNDASSVGYPARDPNAIAVASTNNSDAISSFSNFGPAVFVSAPGESIYSTMPGGGYGTKSGTSMATPHVAGLVALILAREPSADLNRIRTLLEQSALDLGAPGRDPLFGVGRIRAREALSLAQPASPTAPEINLGFAERDLAVGSGLTTRERTTLDQLGNRTSTYDLGDLLARKRRGP